MREREKERIMAECLEEYHRRRALGEPVRPEDWRERLGEDFREFTEILMAASEIDDLLEVPIDEEKFPRTFGEYTLLRILGRGSMGIVYEAMHRSLGRSVALKVLRSGFEDESLARERFLREARACAQVQHDHIISIYDAGFVDDRPYYSMPLVEGRSLLDLVRAGAAPGVEDLCRGLADVSDALGALHDRGIVHRDVKPGNVMVTADGKMILSDFGLARTAASETLTQSGQAIGTPLYMSPEQVLGRRTEVDGRADIYGLGVTIYEALAGHPPFQSDNYPHILKMIVSERPVPLRVAAPDVPAAVSNIAMKAMEKEKTDRYQTAAELRDDLLAFTEGRPVRGRPVSPLRRAARRSKRFVLPAAAILLLAAGLSFLVPPRDAVLELMTIPSAAATLDGVSLGSTPLTVDVRPGPHLLTLRAEGCPELARELSLESGRVHTMELFIPDADSLAAYKAAARRAGVTLRAFEGVKKYRSAFGGKFVEVMLPAGDVRLADLDEWWVTIEPRQDPDGTIEFRRGEEVLYREEFALPERTSYRERIPDEVRSVLREGDTVTWGYFPRSGRPETRTFTVVADPIRERLEEIDRELGNFPDLVRMHVKAQLLLDAGLATAAYDMAERILSRREGSPRALAVELQALREVRATRTRVANGVRVAIDRLAPEEKAELFLSAPR